MQSNQTIKGASYSFEACPLFHALKIEVIVLDELGNLLFMNPEAVKTLNPNHLSPKHINDLFTSASASLVTQFIKLVVAQTGDLVLPSVLSIKGSTQQLRLLGISALDNNPDSPIVLTLDSAIYEQSDRNAVERAQKIKSAISDASLDTLITINMDDEIVDFNETGASMFGWQKSEVLGRKMHEVFVPEAMHQAHNKGLEHYKKTRQGPLLGKRVEIDAKHREGHLIPVELGLVPIDLPDEHLVTAFVRDITDLKKSKQALVLEKEKALQASEAKSRFLSHMSHEIRSPLNAMLGGIALLGETLNEERQDYFYQLVKSSGEALLSIVNEVLDFSKIESGHVELNPQMTSLHQILDPTLQAAMVKCPSTVQLFGFIRNNTPPIAELDALRVRQVITVFLDNAMKFTHRGSVTLMLDHLTANESDTGEAQLLIKIIDTGVGISKAQQDSIFTEFEQADAIRDTGYGGTGLGLTIAKNLVDLMRGSICVDSIKNVGSEFTIRIPCKFVTAPTLYNSEGMPDSIGIIANDEQFFKFINKVFDSYFPHQISTFLTPTSTDFTTWVAQHNIATVLVNANTYKQLKLEELLPSHVELILISCDHKFKRDDQTNEHRVLHAPITSQQLISELKGLTRPLNTNNAAPVSLDENSTSTDNAKPNLSSSSGPKNQFNNIRVLLVEDMLANRLVAKAMLLKQGFHVVEAKDGLEALEIIKTQSFDVVLMDMRMPRLNGLETSKKIRESGEQYANLPIIALTANAERAEMERCKQVGINTFISKPFELEHLLNEIQRLVKPENKL